MGEFRRLLRLVVGSVGLAVVADDLEAANHLADGEETEALGGDHGTGGDGSGVDARGQVGGLRSGSGRRGGAGGRGGGAEKAAGVLEGVHGSLEVGLEGGDGAADDSQTLESLDIAYSRKLTEEPSSGRGRQSWRARDRRGSSRRPRGPAL